MILCKCREIKGCDSPLIFLTKYNSFATSRMSGFVTLCNLSTKILDAIIL